MEELEIQDLLESTATEFNNSFTEKEYPDIQIARFMTITQEGNRQVTTKAYGEQTGTQDLDNGLIDENTTSLETEDVNINAKKMSYLDWAKAVVYTSLAVTRAAKLGISLDTAKLENLRKVALRTIQKTVLKGHAKRKDVTGLLNNGSVNIDDLTGGKSIVDMTGAEARSFMLSLFQYGYEASGSIVMPNTLAIDNMDLLVLSGLYDSSITNGVGNISALVAIKEALKEYTGQQVDIVGVPMGLAMGAGTGNNNRAVVYTNDSSVIRTDWALPPTAGEVFQRSSLSWEIAVQAQYTGAIISDLEQIVYVDYKGSIPKVAKKSK